MDDATIHQLQGINLMTFTIDELYIVLNSLIQQRRNIEFNSNEWKGLNLLIDKTHKLIINYKE